VVTDNDRGPFTKGRVIDLSLAAAKELRMIGRGLMKVTAALQ
jgi:rare lipoprotein A